MCRRMEEQLLEQERRTEQELLVEQIAMMQKIEQMHMSGGTSWPAFASSSSSSGNDATRNDVYRPQGVGGQAAAWYEMACTIPAAQHPLGQFKGQTVSQPNSSCSTNSSGQVLSSLFRCLKAREEEFPSVPGCSGWGKRKCTSGGLFTSPPKAITSSWTRSGGVPSCSGKKIDWAAIDSMEVGSPLSPGSPLAIVAAQETPCDAGTDRELWDSRDGFFVSD